MNPFRSLKSENIGGLVSMTGSSLFALRGDATGAAVTASFLAAEVALTRWGHKRTGYSAGAVLFALGDALASHSSVAANNTTFQLTLLGMAATWSLGAARAPLAWVGEHLANERLLRIADGIQPVVGTLSLVQRVPGIAIAAYGGNYLGAAAVTCWATADVLVGRLQNTVRERLGWNKAKASNDVRPS